MARPRPTETPARRALPIAAALLAVLALLVPAPPAGARAAEDPARLCEAAARRAADRTGVPLHVLMAIALTETGRKSGGRFRPWPWTVNMEGAGHWFGSPQAALGYVETEFARGARSFDVGCFQINYKWHGDAFPSVAAMFDPEANALYAARFLASLFAETGDWSVAAGAYHSRTPAYAERYRARFDRFARALAPGADTPGADTSGAPDPYGAPDGTRYGDPGAYAAWPGDPAIPEIPDIVAAAADGPGAGERRVRGPNTWPLLLGGTGAAPGSLVPLPAATRPLFGTAAAGSAAEG